MGQGSMTDFEIIARALGGTAYQQAIEALARLRAALAERDAEIAALQRYVACCMGGELYTALDAQFPDWRNCVEALRGRGDVHPPELIEQMATEIARLRTVLVSREGTADHLRAVNAQMDKDIQKQCAAEYERDAKIARLRADPNRLDLASVPSGWRFMSLLHPREARAYQRFFAYMERDTTGQTVDGTGPTPAAALAAAVGRIG